MRVTREHDIRSPKTIKKLQQLIADKAGISLHASLPCTVWSQWQKMNIHLRGPKYEEQLRLRRLESINMLKTFIKLADQVLSLGGEISFEWPRYCTGWALPELNDFIARWNLYSVAVDGCACGLTSRSGRPIKKPWRFITSSKRQAVSLEKLKCPH